MKLIIVLIVSIILAALHVWIDSKRKGKKKHVRNSDD